jgi:CRISPR-associated endonuclease/helicase Cas3
MIHGPQGTSQREDAKQSIAHAKRGSGGDGTWAPPHDLEAHLRAVAELAGTAARNFNASDWAHLAGLWHDLGKYRDGFQTYIRDKSGFERENAHVESLGQRVEHSAAGAVHAIDTLGELHGRLLAYLIAGHHAGLPDWNGDNASLFQRLDRARKDRHLQEVINANPPSHILDAKGLKPAGRPKGKAEDLHLWLRLLFSCLVDADFLDTEAYMEPRKAAMRAAYPSIGYLLVRFTDYMERLRAQASATSVNAIRDRVLAQCIEHAGEDRGYGLFSLTVPTGGGKTLASLAFALNHAKAHGKRRVIYVIPYLSIIEQTANEFRKVFGEDVVIEHHSNLDPDKENAASRLAAENWDAPLIVTTNVQLFESLHAARTSRCRKLHNIVDSVVILDEAQLLPPDWLDPCLAAIRALSTHYGVTFVLCTATQPAFRPRKVNDRKFAGLSDVRELMQAGPHVQAPEELYKALERVQVHWPTTLAPQDWDTVAQHMASHPQVLAIVNRKNHARALAEKLPGALYLSTNLCGAHRAERIDEIRLRLAANRERAQAGLPVCPLHVVSTQLIEAGVDVDFPVVLRSLAGLDAIAQAAGRCNREGQLERGKVQVFVPPEPSPPGLLLKAEQATRELLSTHQEPALSPEMFDRFSRLLLSKVNSWDKADMHSLLMPGGQLEFRFREAAEKFRLIDNDGLPVIVRWGKSHDLIDQLNSGKPDRWLLRKLQRYTVNVHPDCLSRLLGKDGVREALPGLYVQANDLIYDETFGFLGCAKDATAYAAQDLVI